MMLRAWCIEKAAGSMAGGLPGSKLLAVKNPAVRPGFFSLTLASEGRE